MGDTLKVPDKPWLDFAAAITVNLGKVPERVVRYYLAHKDEIPMALERGFMTPEVLGKSQPHQVELYVHPQQRTGISGNTLQKLLRDGGKLGRVLSEGSSVVERWRKSPHLYPNDLLGRVGLLWGTTRGLGRDEMVAGLVGGAGVSVHWYPLAETMDERFITLLEMGDCNPCGEIS